MKRILEIPFYPLIFSIYAPIYQFSKNYGVFTSLDLVVGIITQLSITSIALIVVKRVLSSWHQAALFVTLLWISLFSFRPFNNGQPYDSLLYFILVLLPLCVGMYFILRGWHLSLARFAYIFNVGNLLLVAMSTYPVFSAKWSDKNILSGWPEQTLRLNINSDKPKPNIFHILLDGYSRGDVLKNVYQYDNTSFETALKDKGFYISEGSTTPYGQTILALSSIFNAEYLPDIDDKLNIGIQRAALTEQFQHNSIKKILDEIGYTFISTMSAYKPARIMTSDKIFPNEYNTGTLRMFMSAMYDWTPFGVPYRKLLQKVKSTNSVAALTDYALHDPYYMKITKHPFFVFQHVLSPHAPHNIDGNGNVDSSNENIQDADHLTKGLHKNKLLYRTGYVAKLKYTNKAILKQVEKIIKHFSGPLIIIIHGDHGGGMHTYFEDYKKTCVRERFSPFLAIYTRGVNLDYKQIDTLNLVNLYRVIFNASFGSDLSLLKDKHYFTPWSNLGTMNLVDSKRMTEQCPKL